MFGWFIKARAWRSDSNRATTTLVSIPHLMSFRATFRRTGFSCSASYTILRVLILVVIGHRNSQAGEGGLRRVGRF